VTLSVTRFHIGGDLNLQNETLINVLCLENTGLTYQVTSSRLPTVHVRAFL
jgi:hypothetical protein